MVDNFDSTMKEPTLLPVKFPSILVNPSNGIAVGMSSSIPSFSLVNTCKATIGIIKGEITDAESLMEVLGVPEYTTGGFIHASKEDLTELGRTGKGSFVMSGTVTTYPDKIIISEIPYRTTAEEIVAAIEEHIKAGDLKEVSEVSDEIDINGFRLAVILKSRVNPRAVLQKLCIMTPLRTSISFNTRVIIGDRCEELGLYDLLNKWIDFRTNSINRIYLFRRDKANKEEHLLSAWEKVAADIENVAILIAKNNEVTAKSILMSKYGLDEIQAEYFLDMKVRMISKNNLAKKLNELAEKRKDIKEYTTIIDSDNEKYKIIVADLERIIKNYGTKNKTQHADPIVETVEHVEETKVDDSTVTVILTKNGYLKRLASLKDMTTYVVPEDDEEVKRWAVRNNEDILVFTYDGTVYKILVNSIDASRTGLKDEVYKLAGLPNRSQIMLVDAARDYSGYFNLVYPNGRGTRVYYSRAKGNRKKYKGLFDKCEKGKVWYTFADKFFMITAKRKAAYCSLELMGIMNTRVAFKVARVNSGDYIWGLQPIENVPDISKIDLDKYRKDYTVCINDDVLWEGAEKKEENEEGEASENNSNVEETN